MNTPQPDTHDGAAAGDPRADSGNAGWSPRWIARLLVLVLVSEIIPVSASLVATALPAIGAQFETTQASWAMTATYLAAGVMMPLLGKLADLHGKKRLLVWSLVITVVGSTMSALATVFWLFVVGRVLQGAAFALAFLCYSLIRDLFPPRLVTFAVSVTVTGTGIVVIGQPFLAGWLLDGYGVAGVFWFLTILTVVMVALAVAVVPETSVRARESRPDFVGAGLLGVGVAAVLLGVSLAPTAGFLSTIVAGLVLIGLLLLVGWIWHARRAAQPLIDLRLLGSRRLLPIVVAGGLVYGAGSSTTLVLPMLAMTPRELGGDYGFGLTASQYALFGVIAGLGLVIGGLLVGLTARHGARTHMIISAVLLVIGVLGSALFMGDFALLAVSTAVAGLGLGIGAAAIPNLVIEAVPPQQQVISSSIVEVSRTLIASIITPVVFVALNSNIGQLVEGQPIYTSAGFDGAYLVLGISLAAGGLVALLINRRRSVPDTDPRTLSEAV